MEPDKPLSASVRFEFQVSLKEVQRIIRRPIEDTSRLCQTLVLAHQLKYLMESRNIRSMFKLAQWLKLSYSRVNQIMALVYLAPDIKEQILCSKDPGVMAVAENDIRPIASELMWEKQRKRWEHLKIYKKALVEDVVDPIKDIEAP